MAVETKKIEIGKGTIDTCPVCGYTDGFHVSFKSDGDTKIILICPQCHSRFDPDWRLAI